MEPGKCWPAIGTAQPQASTWPVTGVTTIFAGRVVKHEAKCSVVSHGGVDGGDQDGKEMHALEWFGGGVCYVVADPSATLQCCSAKPLSDQARNKIALQQAAEGRDALKRQIAHHVSALRAAGQARS